MSRTTINKNSTVSITLMVLILSGAISITAFLFSIKSDVRSVCEEVKGIKEMITMLHGNDKTAINKE